MFDNSNYKPVPWNWRDIEKPLKARKQRVYEVSDLFHESATDEQLAQIFAVMALTPQHIYQCLAKRPQRMRQYLTDSDTERRIFKTACGFADEFPRLKSIPHQWPIPNVWLGVTCENQKTADERIPLLLQTPAAVRFLSCEPLLEAIDLEKAFSVYDSNGEPSSPRCNSDGSSAISWVITGGESGHGARPCNIEYIRSIVEQCREAGVACFVKQLGSNPVMNVYDWYDWCEEEGWDRDEAKLIGWEYEWGQPPLGTLCFIPSKGKGGNPEEWPKDLRVREFPQVKQLVSAP